MKSTTVFALVASALPFAMAMPYNAPQHAERDANADVEIAWVTDVEIATVIEQVTTYWTGEPASTETVISVPVTTSSAAPVQTSVPAHNRQHDGNGHGRRSTVGYTIEKTTSSVPAPTSTSTVAPPPPPPAPTTLTTIVAPVSTEAPTSSSVEAPVSVQVSSFTAPSLGQYTAAVYPSSTLEPTWISDKWVPYAPIATNLATGPSDYIGLPQDAMQGIRTGPQSYQGDNFKAAVLARHNAWRAKWGVGALVWNDTQAAQAQALADKAHKGDCFTGHDRDGSQNLAYSMTSASEPGPDDGPNGLVDQWGSEARNWQISHRDGTLPMVMDRDNSSVPYEPKQASVLHFTTLMWRDTTSVGCGLQQCGGNEWYIVCNYYPWTNLGSPDTANFVDAEGRKGTYAYQVPSVPVY